MANTLKSAFSLIELIIALSIIGTVLAISINTLSVILKNSNLTQKQEQISKIQNALEIASSYLRSRVSNSEKYDKNSLMWSSVNEYLLKNKSYTPIVFKILENKSILTKIDKNIATKSAKESTNTNLEKFEAAIVFKGISLQPSSFGYDGSPNIAKIRITTDDIIELDPNYNGHITKSYEIITSAYALIHENKKLWFVYNYKPWTVQKIEKAKKVLLLDEISDIEFKKSNLGITIKLCLKDNICRQKLIP